ncbi:MAG: alpha-galactosidase [Propionibacterium sp.]
MEPQVQMVHMRARGSSIVIAFEPDIAPCIVYWGPDLGRPSSQMLHDMALAGVEALGGNAPGLPVRVPLIPESRTGWTGRPGLVGQREAGRDWSTRFRTEGLVIDCQDERPDGGLVTTGAGTCRISLADHQCGLSLQLDVEMLPTGMVRLRAGLTNDKPSDFELAELSIALPLPLEATELLDFSGRWGRERVPVRVPFALGCRLHEQRRGRTGFDAPMMMFAGERGFGFRSGQLWGIHVAHSGNVRVWAEKCPDGRQLIGGGELLLPGEMVLAQGQHYLGPWLYFSQAQGLDAAAAQIHGWLRARPAHPSVLRPVTLNVWEAVYFDHDLDRLTRLAETAAEVGVERFVLDDGWFRGRHDPTAGLGDWYPDESSWPQGLTPLVGRVKQLGMGFGLWFEPEMVNPDSDLARAHPEWIMASGERLPVEWRHQQVLNLAIPEAFDYVYSRMSELVTEYGIDYIKWDHNRDLIEAGNQLDGGRPCVHDQTLAVYRLMDALRRKHPQLEIESCSSGGARIDLEMAQHAQRFWPSDCIDPLDRQSIMRWTEQLIPLEMLGSHVASQTSRTTGRRSSLSFRAGTALWGHFGIEWDLTGATEHELEELALWIQLFKAKRELLFSGELVRGDSPESSLWVQGVVSTDRAEALYELTTRHRSEISPRGRFRLPGLDAESVYRVRPLIVADGPEGLISPPWFGPHGEGVEMTGQMLDLCGVHTPKMFTDQVLLVEAVRVPQFHQSS